MASFHFVTVWEFEAPLKPVWEKLFYAEHWPDWWKGVEEVEVIYEGDANRIYRWTSQTWKSWLPYRLVFEALVIRIEPMSLIKVQVHGELKGTGIMSFSSNGVLTTFQYDWQVSTTKPWMNLLDPIARPIFAWNHNKIMNWGAEGLAKEVGAKRFRTSEKQIP